MDVLIVYGTGEGHTGRIAEFCGKRLAGAGHHTEMRNCDRRMAGLDVANYDAVILAGSVHQQRHQESLEYFTIAHRRKLQNIPSLFLSVSLSIAFENGETEANSYVQKFIENTGFEPRQVALVAGALRFDQYSYYMSHIVEHVVLQEREAIKQDREFTDWDKLAGTVDAFAASLTT